LRATFFDVNGIVLIFAIAGLFVAFSVLSPNFLTITNIRVLVETMSILVLLALGQHFLLIAGEIDISFTATLELAAVVAALASGMNVFLVAALAVMVSLVVGAINGFFTTRVGIPSFLVTLATMVGVQGVVFLISNYRSVLLRNEVIRDVFYGRWFFGVSAAVIWMILGIAASSFVLRSTRFGRWIFATGGNENAARLMGIPTTRVKFVLFLLMSLMAAAAGLIATGRSLAARPKMGENYLMPVIAAPILAGALLTGGRGSVARTVMGCLVLTVIINGVNLLGLQPAYQNIFMGAILLGTLSVRSLQEGGVKGLFSRLAKGPPGGGPLGGAPAEEKP
jgi:ribose/xylose/arabinose/galactoside ABC-type transport system permease subunit